MPPATTRRACYPFDRPLNDSFFDNRSGMSCRLICSHKNQFCELSYVMSDSGGVTAVPKSTPPFTKQPDCPNWGSRELVEYGLCGIWAESTIRRDIRYVPDVNDAGE